MQRLDERMRVLRHLRPGRTTGPDRPHGLVRDDESFVPRKSRRLTSEDGLGLAALALGIGLAHARNHGESCAPDLVDAAERWFADHGLKVQRNQPYAGGFTTQRYGRPGLNRHALQIEINRSLYMDESRHQKLANAAAIERIMTGLLKEIAAQALTVLLPRPLAAE